MRKVLSEKIKTASMEELLCGVTMNAPEEIDVDLIRPFKTRFFIKPNILQMNGSYVITDPKG